MSDTLQVEARDAVGTRNNIRLRSTGYLPAVLYGHGKDPVNLSVSLDQVRAVLRHGGKIVDLEGAAKGQALVQDTQWDTFGSRLLHLDLLRVDESQKIHVEVEVELKGEAAGQREGGVVEQTVRTVTIEASPSSIPDKLHIDITELHLNGSLTAAEIVDLPEGAELLTESGTVMVHCVPPADEPDQEGVATAAGEPELVGGKGGEEASGDD